MKITPKCVYACSKGYCRALIRASIKKSRRWDIKISRVKVRCLYSESGRDWIWPSFELIRDFMVVLVTFSPIINFQSSISFSVMAATF